MLETYINIYTKITHNTYLDPMCLCHLKLKNIKNTLRKRPLKHKTYLYTFNKLHIKT